MKNKSSIKGNGNAVFQGIKDSNINTQETSSNSNNIYVIIGIILALLTLLTSIIVGWDNIQNFFSK